MMYYYSLDSGFCLNQMAQEKVNKTLKLFHNFLNTQKFLVISHSQKKRKSQIRFCAYKILDSQVMRFF